MVSIHFHNVRYAVVINVVLLNKFAIHQAVDVFVNQTLPAIVVINVKSDSFHLEESNLLGCSRCWCAGASNKCRSSDYVYIKLKDMLNRFGTKSDLKVILDKKNSSSSSSNGILNNDGWTASKLVFVTEKSFNDYVLNSISRPSDAASIVTDDESTTKLTLDENQVSASLPENERKEISVNQDSKQINVIYGYLFPFAKQLSRQKANFLRWSAILCNYKCNIRYLMKESSLDLM